jgi:hypothetical protein
MRKSAWTGIAAFLILTPAVAQAQTCIGVPISAGQFALGGEVGFHDGAKSYGGVATANLNGPLSVQGRVDVLKYDDVDESTTSFGGTLAYQLVSAPRYTVCPLVGATYMSESFEDEGSSMELSALVVPVGLGFGAALPVSGLDLSAFAVPQLLIIRSSIDLDLGGVETSESETETKFGADIGLRLRTGPVFFGGSVNITNIEDSDPVFSVGIGFATGS